MVDMELSVIGSEVDAAASGFWTIANGGVAERYGSDGTYDRAVTVTLPEGAVGYGLAVVGTEAWTLHFGYDPDYVPGIVRFDLADGSVLSETPWIVTSWYPDWVAYDGAVMWVVDSVTPSSDVRLYTVDLSTGARTLQATLGAPPDLVSGATDLWHVGAQWVAGSLWAPSGVATSASGPRFGLNRIDTSSGAVLETVMLPDEYASGQRLDVSGLAHDGTNWLVGSANGSEVVTVVVDAGGGLVDVYDRDGSGTALGMDVE